MNLIHRNRVGRSRQACLKRSPLRSPFPSGARLLSRIRPVWLSVMGRWFCIRLLQCFVEGNLNKPSTLGKGNRSVRPSRILGVMS